MPRKGQCIVTPCRSLLRTGASFSGSMLLGGEVGGPASRSPVTTSDDECRCCRCCVCSLCPLAFFVDGVCSLVRSLFCVGPWGSVRGARSVYRLAFWLSFDPIYTSLHTSLLDRHFLREFVWRLLSTDVSRGLSQTFRDQVRCQSHQVPKDSLSIGWPTSGRRSSHGERTDAAACGSHGASHIIPRSLRTSLATIIGVKSHAKAGRTAAGEAVEDVEWEKEEIEMEE
jgi:hypothetical protein